MRAPGYRPAWSDAGSAGVDRPDSAWTSPAGRRRPAVDGWTWGRAPPGSAPPWRYASAHPADRPCPTPPPLPRDLAVSVDFSRRRQLLSPPKVQDRGGEGGGGRVSGFNRPLGFAQRAA